jgi:peptide/nickel transport system permease protein
MQFSTQGFDMALELPDLSVQAGTSDFGIPAIADVATTRLRIIKSWADVWMPASFFLLIALTCFLWPLIYPVPSPSRELLQFANLPPLSPHYLFGTDPLGADIFSRILYGGRISIEVGLGANAIGMAIGGLLGMLAGFRGGAVEAIIMRILDLFLAFPPLVLALVLVSYLGPSELHVIWAISFFSIPAFARLSRATTLRLREQTFVVAAKLSGTRDSRILVRHIAPNVVPALMTFAFLGIAVAIIVEATLSFLGLGVPPPAPSWGNMIAVGESYLSSNAYLIIIPSAFLFATVLSLNLLGDALRARTGDF